MPANKADDQARTQWGPAYDAIPKSVFALAAWHLANLASGQCDAPGAAEGRLALEVLRLGTGGHITQAQQRRALAALPAPVCDLCNVALVNHQCPECDLEFHA